VEAPRRTPGGRISRAQYANSEARKASSRERLRASLPTRREALGVVVVRTPSGRLTRSKYPTPEARRIGALAKLRATLADRSSTSTPVIRTSSGRISMARYPTPEARRAGALATRRSNQSACNQEVAINEQPSIKFSQVRVVDRQDYAALCRDIIFEATILSDSSLNKKLLVAKTLE